MKVAAMAAWSVAHDVSLHELAQQVQQLCSLSHPTTMSVSAGLAQIAALQYCFSIQPKDFAKDEFVAHIVAASEIGRQFYPETQTEDDITERLKTLGEVAARGAEAIIKEYDGGGCYVYQSLPFALAFFLTGPDDRETIYRVIEAGGDTDSNAAMVGALQGALHGPALFTTSLVAQVRGLPELVRTVQRFFERVQCNSDSFCQGRV
jgi:ADP-ribosylglycohydrolase